MYVCKREIERNKNTFYQDIQLTFYFIKKTASENKIFHPKPISRLVCTTGREASKSLFGRGSALQWECPSQ